MWPQSCQEVLPRHIPSATVVNLSKLVSLVYGWEGPVSDPSHGQPASDRQPTQASQPVRQPEARQNSAAPRPKLLQASNTRHHVRFYADAYRTKRNGGTPTEFGTTITILVIKFKQSLSHITLSGRYGSPEQIEEEVLRRISMFSSLGLVIVHLCPAFAVFDF